DTFIIYVSSSTGDDIRGVPNDPTHPYKTIAKGLSMLGNSHPDWLLLKKGDTWTDEQFGSPFSHSGRSASEPLLLSSYGTGARPLLKVSSTNNTNLVGIGTFGGAGTGGDYLAIVGIEFYAYTRDPGSPSYNAADTVISGAQFLNPINWMLIEDCKWS